MKVTANQSLVSTTEETLDIKVVWNPSNPEEDGMVALVATLIDLVNKYNRLNTLVDDGQ